MAKERDEYLDHMESLFGHPGWKYIEEDARRRIYQLQADALEAPTWEQVKVMQGQAIALNELLLLPQVVENQRDAYNRED